MTNINFITLILSLTFFINVSCTTQPNNSKLLDTSKVTHKIQNDTSLNGLYAGLEEMCWIDSTGKKDCYSDPTKPKWKWYYLSYLKVKGDSVFLEQNPISIYKKDTSFSASDGAFYYYNGTYKKKDSILTIDFKMDHCDYCPHEVKKLANGQLEEVEQRKKMIAFVRSDGLFINGYLFQREK